MKGSKLDKWYAFVIRASITGLSTKLRLLKGHGISKIELIKKNHLEIKVMTLKSILYTKVMNEHYMLEICSENSVNMITYNLNLIS